MIRAQRLPALTALLVMTAIAAEQDPFDTPDKRLLRGSEAEQIAVVNSALDKGFPPDLSSYLAGLIVAKRSLVLPLMEAKVEQVLASRAPLECFSDKTVDPQQFVDRVAALIAAAGDIEAMQQIAKLVRIDEGRFGRLIDIVLIDSMDYSKSHNPFVVAYGGLALRDPAVDRRILDWVEKRLSVDPEERARAETAARGYGPTPPAPAEKMKRFWAEAMLDRYGGIPNESQWARDPIASRLRAPLAASLRQEMPPVAREALQKRIPK